jgi:hypothetical protein
MGCGASAFQCEPLTNTPLERILSVGMKTWTTILALATMMIAPIACAIVICPMVSAHDCCPASTSFAACPFDILSSAKATLPAVVAVPFSSLTVQIVSFTVEPLRSFAVDARDLYVHNCVLRI